MEKRLILAVALSIMIIVGFQVLSKPPKTAEQVMPPCPVSDKAVSAPAEKAPEISEIPTTNIEESVKVVGNNLYDCAFSDVCGGIKAITLKTFKEAGSTEPLSLTNIPIQKEYIGSIALSMVAESAQVGRYAHEYLDDGAIFKTKVGSLEITKKYTLLKDKFAIGLNIQIKNVGNAPETLDYRIIAGSGVNEICPADQRLIEVSSKVDGRIIGFKHPKNLKITNPGSVEWTALKNKYFSIIMKPFGKTAGHYYNISKDGYLVNGLDSGAITIEPGSTSEQKYLIYAGPSDIHYLNQVGYGLDETVNYGMFGIISKGIIIVMKFFYSIVHSWGISILLLSIFLNLVTFPLTMKSFQSMQKMQELHPQMEKLKVQYKGNPQKLNQEMMELYKTYKINPFSGCLPMLLQMPIFFALYQALMKSIELRCTKFLWINDLSMPDAVPLPVTLPLIGNTLNILPLFMVAAMVIQQKMSTSTMGSAVTAEQREQQKVMLVVMPIMFGFIFYNMPSGLVLYWVTNTVLTIIEQRAILKKA